MDNRSLCDNNQCPTRCFCSGIFSMIGSWVDSDGITLTRVFPVTRSSILPETLYVILTHASDARPSNTSMSDAEAVKSRQNRWAARMVELCELIFLLLSQHCIIV